MEHDEMMHAYDVATDLFRRGAEASTRAAVWSGRHGGQRDYRRAADAIEYADQLQRIGAMLLRALLNNDFDRASSIVANLGDLEENGLPL